jgi:electron transfer flavoprotein alpha/beta subunit
LKARKSKIEIWNADDLSNTADINRFGMKASPTQVYRITIPSVEGRQGKVFKGMPEKVAKELADELQKILKGEK